MVIKERIIKDKHEALKELEKTVNTYRNYDWGIHSLPTAILESIEIAIEVMKQTTWINVKESLPPQSKGYNTSKWVLVTVKTSKDTKFICMGRYSYESNHWDISNYEYGVTPVYLKDKNKITAWADVDPFEDYEQVQKEQEDTYKYLLNGAESLVEEHPDLVRDIWNCSSCEHTEDECKDCYPELGYKNNKAKRDTKAVKEFVESDVFEKLMKSLDDKDTKDAEQFLRDIKEQEEVMYYPQVEGVTPTVVSTEKMTDSESENKE